MELLYNTIYKQCKFLGKILMKILPTVKDFIKPEYKTVGSGAFDIYLQSDTKIITGTDNEVKLGFKAAVPKGYVALLVPRSSTGINGLRLRNTIGVIDSDYRGEWIAHIAYDEQGENYYGEEHLFKRCDRIIQCLVVPINQESLDIVDYLDTTERGEGGFGSTNENTIV